MKLWKHMQKKAAINKKHIWKCRRWRIRKNCIWSSTLSSRKMEWVWLSNRKKSRRNSALCKNYGGSRCIWCIVIQKMLQRINSFESVLWNYKKWCGAGIWSFFSRDILKKTKENRSGIWADWLKKKKVIDGINMI